MFDTLAYGGNPTVWIIVVVVAVLLFGAGRIPEMMKGLGTGMKEFKKGLTEEDEAKKTEADKEKDEAVKK